MEKINIVCLKWGTKYGPEYVNNLFNAVKKNTTLPFTFYCFTEDAAGIDPQVVIKPLKYNNIESWWNKLYLFSNDIEIEGRIFFLDLDTVITGNIDHMLLVQDEFVVLRDFYTGLAKGLEGNFHVGSAVMIWTAGKHTHIWESFIKNPQAAIKELYPHGDQKWVQKMQPSRTYWQDLFPGQVLSFKVHCRDGLPKDARIVCFHGKPSIPESYTITTKAQWWTITPQPWVETYWKGL